MPLLLDCLPEDIAQLHASLEATLEKRRNLQRQSVEFAAAEPPAVEALQAARDALDEAEGDCDLATDENEKTLRAVRDRRRREVTDAEQQLERVQRIRRSGVVRLADSDREIEASFPPFSQLMQQFGAEVCAAYRLLLLQAAEGLARELRVGYALHDAVPHSGQLRQALSGVAVDDIGPQPGRPVARIIQGERVWLNDEDGPGGGTLRDWKNDPEIVALHELLRPLGATHEAATVCMRRIEADRRNGPAPAPAKAAPVPVISAEEFIASQPTLEEHRAIMAEQRAKDYAATGVTRPVQHTYAEPGRLADRPIA